MYLADKQSSNGDLFIPIKSPRLLWIALLISFCFTYFCFTHTYASTPNRLSVLVEKWPGDIHPINTVTLEGVLISNQIFDPLVTIGPGGEISPNLLENWSYSQEQKRYYFRLKKEIHFSNGEVLKTKHVINMFNRILKAKRFRNFERIHGAKEFIAGRSPSISGINVIDDYRFSIDFEVIHPRFLEDLADPYAVIFLETNRASYPLGTGYYKLLKVDEKNKNILLGRNTFKTKADQSFDELMFTSDLSQNIDFSFVDGPSIQGRLSDKQTYFDTEVYLLAFNSAHPSLRGSDVRITLANHLTPAMVDQALGKVRYRIGGYIPLGMAGHNPDLAFPSNPKKKTALPRKVTLLSYFPQLQALSEAYCRSLIQDGINCKAKLTTFDEIFKAKENNTLEISFIRQKSTNYTVEYLLSCFAFDSIFNVFLPLNLQDPLTSKLEKMFQETLEVPNSNKAKLVKQYMEIDQTVVNSGLVKPFRYGATKNIWSSSRIKIPAIDTLGPFGIKFHQVQLRSDL